MKRSEVLQDAIGLIDETLIADAEMNRPKRWKKWMTAVACVGLAAACTVTAAVLRHDPSSVESVPELSVPATTDPNGFWVDNRPRNGSLLQTENSAIAWPWEYLAVFEQYSCLTFGGKEYRSRERAISAEWIGEKLGDETAKSDDMYDKLHTCQCEVYEVKGVSPDRLVAVKYDGYEACYLFVRSQYDPPQTLGELIDELDLTKTFPLARFSDETTAEELPAYMLVSGGNETLWKLFSACADAKRVETDRYLHQQTRITFTIDAEALGLENKAWSVCREGYLWTNIDEFGYWFEIGTEAANAIIDYALAHKTEVPKKVRYYLAGVVTEIGEDSLKIDDTRLMENPDDGMVFTVYANDYRIRRYIDSGYLEIGDFVLIEHGGLDAENPTVVRNAATLETAHLTESGDIAVWE